MLSKKYKSKSKKGVRRVGRKMRIARPLRYNANRIGGPNTARVNETLPTINILPNTPYVLSIGGITGTRAIAHAPEYALYRIAKIVMRYKPKYDTYSQSLVGGNGPVSVPTLYWKMNRFADAPTSFTANDLKVLGAKPIRFDDKQYTQSYKPNILLPNSSGGSISGSVKITPWLNTDDASLTGTFSPSTTQHFGHFFYVECDTAGTGTVPVGTFDATIYYEFKNPRTDWTTDTAPPTIQFMDEVNKVLHPVSVSGH